ncbi:hypothetical protein TrVGV298_007012 [Trichoderma virens]|nr:hypothetical protein TrVGV298_007012 [Trichoderma virens]
MDLAATYSREITGNHFGNNTTIHQGDVHYHSSTDKTRENEDLKCLTDLRTTDPRDDKTRIEATKGGLFKDSYRWILDHSDFQKWRDEERSRLLWIKGDPGKGKTMLLCGIVNELSPQTRLQGRKANTLLSYFFYQAADERINSATAVLRGLIYLIVKQQPLLVSHIQEKYKDGREIFSNILEDASLERTYIIIDALDECVTDLPKLLDFISTKSVLFSRVKWIVSSRNWPDIEDGLDSTTQQMRLCLELNEKSISAAVDAYIKHQVEWLAQKKKYNAITKDAVHHHLSSNSNNTFLWVALILATVLLVYRPITLAELSSLVESPDDDPADAELIHKAIGFCGSFLTVKDSRVYVIHQSAKDYLSSKAVPTIFPSGSANVHGIIFSQSLQAMSATLRRNIYNLYSPGLPINDIKAPDPDPLTAVRQSQDQVDHKYQTVFLFLQKYFLYWLEALGLMGHIEDGVLSITRLENLLRVYTSALIFSPLNSLIRKIFEEEDLQWLKLKPTVEYNWSPYLQTLGGHEDSVNSVAFSADGRYLASGSRGIKIWDATMGKERQTLKGPWVRSVAFSPNGRYLASVSDGITIWDVTTGKEQQTLKGSTTVKSVAFLADSRYLALGLSNGGITIWDTITGKERQILKGSTTVELMAFSSNGRYLASVSDSIIIWDVTIGKKRQTLKGSTTVKSVAFSPDGCYLALGLWNGSTIIWDATTGKEQQILKSSGPAGPVAFSADGRYLASVSGGMKMLDTTIKIWDAITGKERQTLTIRDAMTGKEQQALGGSNCWVMSVAFSAGGRYLASGLSNGGIKIWDATIKISDAITGKERQTFKGSSPVRSVAFSPDGRYLASASDDITIWDATTGKEQQTLKGSSSVGSVAFSPDGHLASGLWNGGITIWDVTTGKERQTLKGSGTVESVAFSPDGRYLALLLPGSTGPSITIWDATTGKERQRLRDSSPVSPVAFSADGRYLASGLWNGGIIIWDATTGKVLQTLKVGTTIHTISFDDTASYLHTEIGPIKLGIEHRTEAQVLSPDSNPAQGQDQRRLIANDAEKANHVSYGLSADKCWITWNGHNLLWLPPEYQPSTSAIWPCAPSSSPQVPLTDVAMALGSGLGRVVACDTHFKFQSLLY